MSMLVYEELRTKRDRQIKGLREGLKELEIYDIVKVTLKCSEPILYIRSVKFRPSNLSVPVEIEETKWKVHDNILIWLEQFISESSDKVAQMFLNFCTSFGVVPLTWVIEINVEFLKPDEGPFPKTAACTKKKICYSRNLRQF